MVKYLIDRNEKRDAMLFYSNRTPDEIAYREIFDEAGQKIGMRTVYMITEGPNGGRLTADSIKKEIPDYRDRMFYISGTHAMTNSFKTTLHEHGRAARETSKLISSQDSRNARRLKIARDRLGGGNDPLSKRPEQLFPTRLLSDFLKMPPDGIRA